MTLYFKKEHFKTAIPLAITSMLVMYTLKGSITSKLPATSYIKFVDIWLLYGLLIPFFILLLLGLIEHLPAKSKVKLRARNNLRNNLFINSPNKRVRVRKYKNNFEFEHFRTMQVSSSMVRSQDMNNIQSYKLPNA